MKRFLHECPRLRGEPERELARQSAATVVIGENDPHA